MRTLAVLGLAGIVIAGGLLASIGSESNPALVLLACAFGLGGVLCLVGLYTCMRDAHIIERLRERMRNTSAD